MTKHNIPTQMSERRYRIIKTLGENERALTTVELGELGPPDDKAKTQKEVDNLWRQKRGVDRKPNPDAESRSKVVYYLSELGRAMYDALDTIEIVPLRRTPNTQDPLFDDDGNEIPQPKKRKPYKKRQSKQEVTSFAEPPPLNLSVSAEMLVDNLSAVVKESAAYRQLMEDVYHTIGDALQLNKQTINQEEGDHG